MIRLAAVAGSALILATAGASAAPSPLSNVTTAADAVILRITIPGQAPIALGQIAWPANT